MAEPPIPPLLARLGSGYHSIYEKNGKVYRFRWFRKDELIGVIPPKSQPQKEKQ